MKKREYLTIIYDILKTIQNLRGEAKTTHIIYKANLSHQMFTEYIEELIKRELITKINKNNKKTYSLTEKGFNYLKDYMAIKGFAESYGLD